MRILTNGFGGLEPAAWALEAEHDVVRLSRDDCHAAWARGERSWQEDLLPEGWVPDVALLYSPEYQLLPPDWWDLPCPVVLWIGDWHVDPNGIRQLAPYADLLLADGRGAKELRGTGVANVAECTPWLHDPAKFQPAWDDNWVYDLGFVGTLNDVIHLERNQWLERILHLPERYRVKVHGGIFGETYGEILRRSRIGFNYTVAGGVNMRTFEVPASGSLLMVERTNTEIRDWFRDGEECVLYGPEDFEELVTHFLDNEDERARIAEAGWRRVQEHAPDAKLPQLVEYLEAVASAPPRRQRPDAVTAARLAAHQACYFPEPDRPYGDVEAVLDEAEQVAPDDAALLMSRAYLYSTYALLVGEGVTDPAADDALDYLARAVAADPADALARYNEAALLHLAKRKVEAEAAFRALLAALDGGEAVVRPDRLLFRPLFDDFVMGWARTSFGAPDELPEALGALLAAECAERVATLTDDAAERRALLERALAVRPRVDTHRRLAAEHVAAGDLESALAETEAALAIKPLLEQPWEERVGLLVALGRVAEARELAERVARMGVRMPALRPVAARLRARVDAADPSFRPAECEAA